MLDFWQEKIDVDTKAKRQYSFPDIVKQLVIEYQEYLFVLQKVIKAIDQNYKVNFRKNQSVDKGKKATAGPKKTDTKTPISPTTKQSTMKLNLPSAREEGEGNDATSARKQSARKEPVKEKEAPPLTMHERLELADEKEL